MSEGMKARLVSEFQADMSAFVIQLKAPDRVTVQVDRGTDGAAMACRCYRCGRLLTVETVQISMGVLGPRPVCEECLGD